ncbi:YbgA family protein [Candidatus Bipolaricaulota bacterium]
MGNRRSRGRSLHRSAGQHVWRDEWPQPETGRDVTAEMASYTESFLDTLDEVDGFILKYRSPSCGPNQVKIYNSRKPEAASRKGSGAFGGRIIERFCGFPIEDEGRLHNFDIRQHFLTQLFTLARFRDVAREGIMGALVDFHSRHKYLLMAYSQGGLKRLGRIVANAEHRPAGEVIDAYRAGLLRALARPPRRTGSVNVLLHVLGYVSDGLSAAEKAFFLDELERYRSQRVCLSAPTSLLRSWIVRFDVPYLMDQFYFEPFPEALVEVLDSGKGRKLD